MASTTNSSTELLAIGKQCSHQTCHLVDFLPFTCQHCQLAFCQEHFRVEAHECPKYDASKYDRKAIDCPFCNVPVGVQPGQDPNIRLEDHFERECAVLGKKAKKSPQCANVRCNKVLFAPISCNNCKKQFCPAHRFPDSHTCVPTAAAKPVPATATKTRSTALTAGSRLLNLGSSGAGPKKAVSAPAPPAPSSGSSKPLISVNTPFSKTDRRARAERESRKKALQERAKKGLLTEEEKLLLAEAEQASEKKDCLIM